MDVAETVRELEASLVINSVRKERTRVSALLAEEFREFGRSRKVYSRAAILDFLQSEEEIRVAIKYFACEVVAEGIALVTYLSELEEQNGETVGALRSSLRVWRDQRWQMVFHQGTPLGAPVARQVKA
jgi:hypothetical protein